MRNLLFLLFTILCSKVFNQPSIEWAKCYGGSDDDGAAKMIQTFDGDFIIAGHTWSKNGDVQFNHGKCDVLILKIDENGIVKWSKTYGGSRVERPSDIKQTSDGGFIFCGPTDSNDGDVSGYHGFPQIGNYDIWVVKLDSVGKINWQKSLGGTGYDYARSIIQTRDGGYLVAGNSNSKDGDVSFNFGSTDFWLVKLDNSGTIIWEKSYGGPGSDEPRSILQTEDGGYLTFGYSMGDFIAFRLDSIGNIIWQNHYGGTKWEQPMAAIQTSDGGFLMIGDTDSNDGGLSNNHGGQDFLVIKINPSGIIEWQNCFGGSNGDNANAVTQTIDGGYAIAGIASSKDGDVFSNHGNYDYWIIYLDAKGNLIWENSFGGMKSDDPYSIIEFENGKFMVSGETFSSDNDIVDNHGFRDFWVLKLTPLTELVNNKEVKPTKKSIDIFPNPVVDKVFIQMNGNQNLTILVSNLQGDLLITRRIHGEQFIDFSEFAKGIYLVHIITSEGVQITKVAKQ